MIRNLNKHATSQPKLVVPDEKPSVVILAQNTALSASSQPKTQAPPLGSSSVIVKKEIINENAKRTPVEELAIVQKIALVSNLDTEFSLVQDLFAKKKDGQITFTCYASDTNEDAMVTDLSNQADQHTCANRLIKKQYITNIDQCQIDTKMDVDQNTNAHQISAQPDNLKEIITISDDDNSFVLINKIFTIYTESNNLLHIRKTDKAHEVLKLLQKYPSDEDSYNKVLQANFHTSIQGEGEDEQRDLRKQHNLRISGLPIGTIAVNLKPIIDEINTMTCFIPHNSYHYKPFSYAYVNFKNEEDKDIAMKKKFLIRQGKTDKPLFISDPATQRYICNNCGNPNHVYAEYNVKKCQTKRANTVKVAWKEQSKITAQNIKKSYAQAVQSPPLKHAQTNQTKKIITQTKANYEHSNNVNNTRKKPDDYLSDTQKAYLCSLVDNLVTQLETQISAEFSTIRGHISSFGNRLNQFKAERNERLKQINTSIAIPIQRTKSPFPIFSTSKNKQNKQVRKGSDFEDQMVGGLQSTIKEALQKLLGNNTNTQDDTLQFDEEEKLLQTDNEEEYADVENNIEA
ncbi:hypothetical protein RclHR1_13520007 [Rhizophagus clarus]|nr:hypothetical protein RclHR1_13520007 [Rhizophagus clarus]